MPSNINEQTPHQYEVTLPCSPDDFRDFVSGLLGKPQTSEAVVQGSYEVDLAILKNLHHLIDQRIHQQNDAKLIQFTASIHYSDDTAIQLNHFDDLVRFQEVHPKVSTAVKLTWVYLIVFRQKRVPERQQIDITFFTAGGGSRTLPVALWTTRRPTIHVSIAYTERTWGFDIESLLVGHLRGLIHPITQPRRFFDRYSGEIGVVSGIIFMLSSVLGILNASSELIRTQTEAAKRIAATASIGNLKISEQLDYLISITGQGVWPRFTFAAVGVLLLAMVLSIVFGAAASALATFRPTSHVLLTDAAAKRRTWANQAARKALALQLASLIGSLAAGVASNIIYTKYFASL